MVQFLRKDQITNIELSLISTCNLQCRFCKQSNLVYYRPYLEIINQLKEFKNLKTVFLYGEFEPTLYPDIFKLLFYLKKNHIIVEIATNGTGKNQLFFKQLALLLDEKDKVIFSICGSNQKIHSYYRVNSNLNTLLENFNFFKNRNKNDTLLSIIFEYNKNDLINIKKVGKIANNFIFQYTCPISERLNLHNKDFYLPKQLSYNYLQLKNLILNNKKDNRIICESYNKKHIYIDVYGNIWPCTVFKRYVNKKIFDKNALIYDYSSILNFTYEQCYECCISMKKFSKYNNISRATELT